MFKLKFTTLGAASANENMLSKKPEQFNRQAIAELQYDELINGRSVLDNYNSLIADVGNKVQESTFIRQNQEKIVQQLQIQKASITGVSLDEEMTQLIQFEQAYGAAAKMISTVDELIQTILSLG